MIKTIGFSALIGAVLASLVTYWASSQHLKAEVADYKLTISEMKATEAANKAQAALSLKKATDTYRANEEASQARSDALATGWAQEKGKLNVKIADLERSLRSGSLHLTAKVIRVPSPSQSGEASGGPDAAGQYELSPEVAGDLAALAGEAQVTAARLNKLQQYVRSVCLAGQEE